MNFKHLVATYIMAAAILTVFSVKKSESFRRMPILAKAVYIALLPLLVLREIFESLKK